MDNCFQYHDEIEKCIDKELHIRRGTTKTITVIIPEQVRVEDMEIVWGILYQSGKVITNKTFEDGVERDIEKNMLFINFTQEDTLALDSNAKAEIQLRVFMNDGYTTLGSQSGDIKVLPIRKGGIMGNGQ